MQQCHFFAFSSIIDYYQEHEYVNNMAACDANLHLNMDTKNVQSMV